MKLHRLDPSLTQGVQVPEATQRLLVTRTQGPDTRVLSGEMLRNATAVQLAQATAAPAPAKVLQRFVLPCCRQVTVPLMLPFLCTPPNVCENRCAYSGKGGFLWHVAAATAQHLIQQPGSMAAAAAP